MSKSTGIIMSGDHPVKIMAKTKTMTRRTYGLEKVNENPDAWCISGHVGSEWGFGNLRCEDDIILKCPYGDVGDELWIKETHFIGGVPSNQWIVYKADGKYDDSKICWRPSIFMPKWASRITLTIKSLRAERLQSITDSDIAKEGIDVTIHNPGDFGLEHPCATAAVDLPNGHRIYSTAQECWIRLWDSLNGKSYPWEMNPWVWVIGFDLSRGK